MSNSFDNEHSHSSSSSMSQEMNHEEMHGSATSTSTLNVGDFNDDGSIDRVDLRDIIDRYEAVAGEDLYDPAYDLNASGAIDSDDLENVIHAFNEAHDSSMEEMEHEQMHGQGMEHEGMGHEQMHGQATSILGVPDFNGDGSIDNAEVKDIVSRYETVKGDDLYHPLYDLNVNGEIDSDDLENVIHALGEEVPLLDQQIAQATQATMKYYGSGGQGQAIADGYIPFTQEVQGHGIHYVNFPLVLEIGESPDLNPNTPVGLNYDTEGNLLAAFYIRFPYDTAAALADPGSITTIDPENDFPPTSFDGISAEDWHTHENLWFTGLGSLNSEEVFGFEDQVPIEVTNSRFENIDFKFFPESDQVYSPKFWMLHGWFHSINPDGNFANLHPEVSVYAPQELGVHGGHGGHGGHDEHGGHNEHGSGESNPLIAGTYAGEGLSGTDGDDRINSFDGDDWIQAGLGNDSVWGSYGNDWIRGDDDHTSEGGDDMLYGGPGDDLIFGHGGNDRLFGGTDDDRLVGGLGDDLLRGSLGYDILTGEGGSDRFVLAMGEGMDIITDFEIEADSLVFYTGITADSVSFSQLDNNTTISFADETLAILNGVNADDLMAASESVFVDV